METFWVLECQNIIYQGTLKQGSHGILCLCSYNAYFYPLITANDLKEKSIGMWPCTHFIACNM